MAVGSPSATGGGMVQRARHVLRVRPGGDPAVGLVALLSLACSAGFVGVSVLYNQGRLIAPLDDVYIHLQYARQIGAGDFFAYQPGDPVSTGASSLLYVVLIGAVAALGLSGSALLAVAVGFGAVCVAGTCALVVLLGTRLASRRVGVWAGLLTALNGPLLWGATSGMEVGLLALLLVAAVYAFVREQPFAVFRATPAVGVLLALTRPEGLIIAGALCAGMVWTLLRVARTPAWLAPELEALSWTSQRWWARIGLAVLPVVAGAGQLLFYRVATGTVQANGVASKSWLHQGAGLPVPEVLGHTLRSVQDLLATFSGLGGAQDLLPPAAGIAALLGLGALLVGPARGWRTLAVVLGAGIVVWLFSVSTLATALWQNLRYVQPLLPLVLLLAVLGLDALTPSPSSSSRSSGSAATPVGAASGEAARREAEERAASVAVRRRLGFHGVAAVGLVFTVVFTPTWAIRLAQQATTIREAPVSVGNWLRGHLPPGSTVGVNDVGAVAYFSGLRTFDLVGLTTNGVTAAANNGPGTLYEHLAGLPADQRPDFFSIYDAWGGVPVQDLARAGVLGEDPLITFYLKSPANPVLGLAPPPCQTDRTCDQVSVWRADWSRVGSGAIPDSPVPGTVRDQLNVGDLADEAAHRWRPDSPVYGVQPISDVTRRELPGRGSVVDSSRRVVGGETFTLGHLVPGRPVTLTARVTPRTDGTLPPANPNTTLTTSPDPAAAAPAVTGIAPSSSGTAAAAPGPAAASSRADRVGQSVAVTAGGAPAGRWVLNPGGGGTAETWSQTSFVIPAELVTGAELTVSTGPLQPFLAPYPDYRSYHYWASQ